MKARFLNGNGLRIWKQILMQHVFASKLRFCLFCLEYILFTPPPKRELARDLREVANYPQQRHRNWAIRKFNKYFS